MAELFVFIIFTFSFLGISIIVGRRLPELSFFSEEKEQSLLVKLKGKFKKINPFKNFSLEIFLQKIIFPIRILSLKIDHLTFKWLRKLKQRHQEKKQKEKDNYWEEIKKEKTKQILRKSKRK